jgi:DNA invertase Pin-like site-specific DNA recombinase
MADFHDVSTGKKRNGRQGLDDALQMLATGEADVLVCSKLDRLARSVMDFGAIVRTSLDEGWSLKVLDPDVDTSTATGRLCGNVLAAIGEWEADVIGERTRDGLAEAKAKGKRLGLAPEIPKPTERRIVRLYAKHQSMARVATILNETNVPTARGGSWHPSTIATVLKRAGAK